jgi:hypothetical protein
MAPVLTQEHGQGELGFVLGVLGVITMGKPVESLRRQALDLLLQPPVIVPVIGIRASVARAAVLAKEGPELRL